MLKSQKKIKKKKAEGYDEGALIVYSELPSEEFIKNPNYLHLLAKASKVVLSEEHKNSPHTTAEIIETCNDIKVSGPREVRKLLKWRHAIIEDKKAAEPEEPEPELTPEEIEQREIDEIDEMIAQAAQEEKAKLKRKKRMMLKAKAEREKRNRLKMDADKEAPVIEEDVELFSLNKIKRDIERRDQKAKALKAAGIKEDSDEEEEEDANSDEDLEKDIDSDEFDVYENDDIIDEAEEALSAPQFNDNLNEVQRQKKKTDSWFDDEVNKICGSDDEDEDVDVIEKHMKRTVSKESMHKNTVSFEDEKKKRKKNDNDENLFGSEEEVYRSDEEYDNGG